MKTTLLFSLAVLFGCTVHSQNADNYYFRSNSPGYDYKAASFVIDIAGVSSPYNTRGMLLWAANTDPFDYGLQAISLDQLDFLGNPLTEHVNLQSGVPYPNLKPKKVIRSEHGKWYYLLAYVAGSPNTIHGLNVYSTPYVLKLDDNLNLIWSSKIHFASPTPANSGAEIEYNDILEADNGDLVLVGRYRENDIQSQALQLARLDGTSGTNIWWFWYYLDNYDANGLSVEELTDGELAVTGYVTGANGLNGGRELLFARFKANGGPLLFRTYQYKRSYDISGDQISRFIDSANQNHFFITGYAEIQGGPGGRHKQNLVIDITQDGTINAAAHYGDDGDEEINDHIFTSYNQPAQFYVLNFTGYTTSYGAREAYYASLEYNWFNKTFYTRNFDVINNTSQLAYDSRTGVEIKFAGNRKFALLLNSSLTTLPPTYTHEVTNVFIRDYSAPYEDTDCFYRKQPPLKHFRLLEKEPKINVQDPPYAIYDEKWEQRPKIAKKLVCGNDWRIYPELAIQGIPRRNRYEGPGDVVRVLHRTITDNKTINGTMLFPNPAENEVSFMQPASFNSKLPVTISLYSSGMRMLRSNRVSAAPVQKIPVNDLQPGLYVLLVQQGTVQQSYRFVKK